MFVRIVKLTFQEDKIDAFLANFEEIKHQIRNFEGNEFFRIVSRQTRCSNFFHLQLLER